MGRMMHEVQLPPLFVVAAIAAYAVFAHKFHDTLIQRIGLAGICIGASLKIVIIVTSRHSDGQSLTVLLYGLAIYGLGTVLKLKRSKS